MARKKKTDKYFSQPYYFDKAELKKEYRSLSKQYHPDIGGSDEVMAVINSQYAALKNDEPLSRPARASKPRTKRAKKESAKQGLFVMQEIITLLDEWDIEYYFDGDIIIAEKGSQTYEMREELKNVGFWWEPVNRYWYWVQEHSKRKTS